jgi:hypothetical protein
MRIKLLITLLAVILIFGCTSEAIIQDNVIKNQEPPKDEVIEETVIQQIIETQEPKLIGEGYCGDGVCQNLENKYPDSKVICDRITRTCKVNNEATENNYVCERDCGVKCDEKVQLGFKPNGCQYTVDKDIEVTLINTGKGDIEGGFIFYITSSTDEVEIQTTTEELKQGTEKPYVVKISKYLEEFGSIKSVQIMPRIIKDNIVRDCSNKKLSIHLNSCY